jgi:uncharacterized protein YndB with AHSA1/START domain
MDTMASSGKVSVVAQGDRQIVITREFDAPKELVWKAWTTPEYVKRWWGGDRGTVASAEIDLRLGGRWRFVQTANEGFEVAFHGEYRELVPFDRMVSTEVYEAIPDAQAINTLTLVEHDGRTTLTIVVEHESIENRDGHLNSGMEIGVDEGFDKLEALAQSLA